MVTTCPLLLITKPVPLLPAGFDAPEFGCPGALAAAWVSQGMSRLFGGETLLTVSGIRTMWESMQYPLSSAKAQRELGVSFRHLIDTLRDEVEWFRQRGKT